MTSGRPSDTLVVLEAGLGMSGLYWARVQSVLPADVLAVAYERSGYGGSDMTDGTRDLSSLACDLEEVIDNYPHRRLILVGHSWGGPIIRTVAARRVDAGLTVSGLVLVDQTDENADSLLTASTRKTFSRQAAALVPLARIGLLRLLSASAIRGLPREVRHATSAASFSLAGARTAAAEMVHIVDGLTELRRRPPLLGAVPVRVISGQRVGFLEQARRAELIRAHQLTADSFTMGRFIPASESNHMIPLTEPGLIAEQIRMLV
ncbi:alpha/beta fold hydrolase [Mycolicibacterium frederiksbergense]|nr:alpha/beta hydrolase [Mycolicibacterium frederiksbergense]